MKSQKNTPSYYAIIPANVRYDKELPAGAKLMYGEITALSNEKGYCFASNGYFSNLYGCTKQAISKWIKELERRGYVNIDYVGNKGETERRVSITVDMGYQSRLMGVSTPVDHNNTSSNKDNAQIKDVEQVTPEWELRFTEFWSRCWRKVGKKRAKSAFKRLSKKDQLACMAEQTISEYLNYLRATGYDAMHPTTWINGRRWEDDFSAPASGNGANTDEALNDRLLPEPLDTDYRRYIAYVIDTFPALWKSKCQVLSKSQWYDLTQTEVFQNLRIAMTPRKARQIRADLHSLFNQNAIERSKYATMYDAVKAEYLRHINHEKTLIA